MPPLWVVASAAWLGLVTAVMPCPMAANVAAMSYVARRVGRTRQAVVSGLLYGLGRSVAYTVIAAVIVAGLLSRVEVESFLRRYLAKLLGPLLILVGMFLLELLSLPTGGSRSGERLQKFADRGGVWAAAPLGMVLALTFCPPSAFVFFGTVIPLSAEHQSPVLLPLVYGLATGLPVAVFGILIALGVGWIGEVFSKVQAFERWARRVTGVVFILVGIYYTLVTIFAVPLWW